MRSVAIAGVGLIGGSLGLALRRAGFTGEIMGVQSERSAAAIRAGAIDRAVTLEEAAAAAEVIYLAQPISAILSTVQRLGSLVRPEMLVTDAGSTKVEICRQAATSLRAGEFLGGHPMAGKATQGVSEADPLLFSGRTYVLTPTSGVRPQSRLAATFAEWLERCGARVRIMTPERHDTVVALTSHLPQVLSTTLGVVLAGLDDESLTVSGPGLLDMTRLAQSSYDIWRDILVTNDTAVQHALDVYIDKLTELRHNMQTQRLDEDFRIGARTAGRLRR
ncbi:MAG TPA: prephenate dehydrogenase/arogenate dehydrogenase family protein [Bryobacteraceae bacterium]|nr:prephenate dehydrogenase/arogenate dehydrogenase family protein [Bryobacteraceae bacterium]